MAWEAGAGWFAWAALAEALGRNSLQHRHGDGGFIEDAAKKYGVSIARLQDSVDGIYSYKVARQKGFPKVRRLCCFHGKPRPHETDVWQRRELA